MKLNLNEFIDQPSAENLEKAHKILRLINAIDGQFKYIFNMMYLINGEIKLKE